MRRSICSILTAAVCFQVSIVVYAILKYSIAAYEMFSQRKRYQKNTVDLSRKA